MIVIKDWLLGRCFEKSVKQKAVGCCANAEAERKSGEMLVDRSCVVVIGPVKLSGGKLQTVALERHFALVSLSDVGKVRWRDHLIALAGLAEFRGEFLRQPNRQRITGGI